jgi:hypothetical protein
MTGLSLPAKEAVALRFNALSPHHMIYVYLVLKLVYTQHVRIRNSRPALEPIQSLFQWVPTNYCLAVKKEGTVPTAHHI